MAEKQIFDDDIIIKVLLEEEIEVDFENKPLFYKKLFIYMRIFVIFLLLAFGIIIWIWELYKAIENT